MSEAHEVIEKLNVETPRKTRAEELKIKWLEEHPGEEAQGFYAFKFKPEWKSWEAKTTEEIETHDSRWDLEKVHVPDLISVDTSIAATISFKDPGTEAAHHAILKQFEESFSFTNPEAPWRVPDDPETVKQWGVMSEAVRRDIQRHATDLAAIVATTRQVATDELKRNAPASVAEWEKSKLYSVLQTMEASLGQWANLLASNAFPDHASMRKAAIAIGDQFQQFYVEHAGRHYGTGKSVPYIEYHMLAAMKALAEKLASQFAARTANPSFSGMYELICDVPKRGSFEKGSLTAKHLTKESAYYTTSHIWDRELRALEKDLEGANPGASARLEAEFAKLPFKLRESFDKWSNSYKAMGANGSKELPSLHAAMGEIAFGLRKYKEAVDAILSSSNPNSLVNAPNVQTVRQRYQEILDGFVMQHEEQLLFCKSLL